MIPGVSIFSTLNVGGHRLNRCDLCQQTVAESELTNVHYARHRFADRLGFYL